MQYQQSLEDAAAASKKSEISNQKAILISEINETKLKRGQLNDTCSLLNQEFVSVVKDAEIKKDLNLY